MWRISSGVLTLRSTSWKAQNEGKHYCYHTCREKLGLSVMLHDWGACNTHHRDTFGGPCWPPCLPRPARPSRPVNHMIFSCMCFVFLGTRAFGCWHPLSLIHVGICFLAVRALAAAPPAFPSTSSYRQYHVTSSAEQGEWCPSAGSLFLTPNVSV